MTTDIVPPEEEFRFEVEAAAPPRIISGFWRRLLAFLIDAAVLGLIGYLLGTLFYSSFAALGEWGRLVGFLVALLYFTLFNSEVGRGHTPGKLLSRIKVVNREGNFLQLGRSLLRYLVIGVPIFFNGIRLPSDFSGSLSQVLAGFVIFGAGGAILYLLACNRRTRQSLHDLVAGTFVVGRQASGPLNAPAVWKGHFAAIGFWLAAVAVLLTVVAPRLARSVPFADLTALQQEIEQIDNVRAASVFTGKSFGSPGRTSFLQINARVYAPCAEYLDLTERIAAAALANYPDADNLDQLSITLVYGYDIGIASHWQYRQVGHAPQDWRFKLERLSAPATGVGLQSVDEEALVSFDRERQAYQSQIRELLYRGEFDRLEEIAAQLRRERPRFSSGLPLLNDYYKALGDGGDGGEGDGLDRHRELLERWLAARPDSATARIALVKVYQGYAWKARGTGFADSVTPEGWKGFIQNLARSREYILEAERTGVEDPALYALAVIMCQGLDKSKGTALSYVEKGAAIDPGFDPLYIYMANYLLPRWHGSPEELHDFALRAVELGGPEWGDIMYVRVAVIPMLKDQQTFRTRYPFSWPRLKQGLETMDRRFPGSARTLNYIGWFACQYGDVAAAEAVLPRLKWGVDSEMEDIWGSRNSFDACRQWLERTR